MGYYNIVNGNIKLYLIVCEKLSPSSRCRDLWIAEFF